MAEAPMMLKTRRGRKSGNTFPLFLVWIEISKSEIQRERDREKKNERERERGMKREEIPIVGGFSRHLLIFFQSIFLLFVSGLADDPSGSKNGIKAESHPTSGSSTGLRVLFIVLGLVAVVLFSIFLFKLYQKKKREEQHARLLRLFEEDDELELELGLRE